MDVVSILQTEEKIELRASICYVNFKYKRIDPVFL